MRREPADQPGEIGRRSVTPACRHAPGRWLIEGDDGGRQAFATQLQGVSGRRQIEMFCLGEQHQAIGQMTILQDVTDRLGGIDPQCTDIFGKDAGAYPEIQSPAGQGHGPTGQIKKTCHEKAARGRPVSRRRG